MTVVLGVIVWFSFRVLSFCVLRVVFSWNSLTIRFVIQLLSFGCHSDMGSKAKNVLVTMESVGLLLRSALDHQLDFHFLFY